MFPGAGDPLLHEGQAAGPEIQPLVEGDGRRVVRLDQQVDLDAPHGPQAAFQLADQGGPDPLPARVRAGRQPVQPAPAPVEGPEHGTGQPGPRSGASVVHDHEVRVAGQGGLKLPGSVFGLEVQARLAPQGGQRRSVLRPRRSHRHSPVLSHGRGLAAATAGTTLEDVKASDGGRTGDLGRVFRSMCGKLCPNWGFEALEGQGTRGSCHSRMVQWLTTPLRTKGSSLTNSSAASRVVKTAMALTVPGSAKGPIMSSSPRS